MTSRRVFALTVTMLVAGALTIGCSGRRQARSYGGAAPVAATTVVSGSGGGSMMGLHTLADRGEKVLEDLPWHPDVLRVNLAANGPVALTQIYAMREDLLAVDTTGKVYCLSRRDLTPRWIASLKAPLAAPPTENGFHYIFLEKDYTGAAWVQWYSLRSGAEANASPVRLSYSPSSGISATVSTAYVGSFGSPVDNKLLETINLADGTPGWGYRPHGRVVATPTLDPTGEILLVLSEDGSITSLPANQAASAPATINWVRETGVPNTAAPAVTKDWAFVGSDDNFLRGMDIHSGAIVWLKGLDAPIRRTPWVLGTTTFKSVPTGGEGSPSAQVESFEGQVFVRNATGLHALDVATGNEVFVDRNAERPLVRVGDWTVVLDTAKQGQLRKGKDMAVTGTVALGVFDFLPTNSRDGTLIAGLADGVILLAVPK